jgi:hypothetical protein
VVVVVLVCLAKALVALLALMAAIGAAVVEGALAVNQVAQGKTKTTTPVLREPLAEEVGLPTPVHLRAETAQSASSGPAQLAHSRPLTSVHHKEKTTCLQKLKTVW